MIFRKAVLLIHGFAGGNWDYGDLGNEIQLYSNFDVYTFTLPGHEKSIISKVTKDDWIKSAEEHIELLINHGYKTIYIVGHSMGGVIACHLARKYKEVKKLILAAPAFKYLSFDGETIDLNSSINSIKKTPELIKDYTLEVVISRAFKMSGKASLEFSKLVKEHHDDPKFINCPTLIIQGTKDVLVPVASAKYVYKNLKSKTKELIFIKDLTHDVFTGERQKEAHNLVINFFKKKYWLNNNEEKTI